MHQLNGVWVVLVLLLSPATAGQNPQDFVEQFNAATKSYQAKDYAAMEQALRAALVLRPVHPAATYNLASAQSLGGQAEAALNTLESLATQGLFFDISKGPDFEPLRMRPRYAELLTRFARTVEPVGTATEAFRILNPRFIPEGLAYDADTGSYFLSGAHERSIVRIRRSTETNHVQPGSGGLLAPLGMQADSRRRLLWVAHAGIEQMLNPAPADLGRSGIIAYDLDTGLVKRRALLPKDGVRHALGDLLLLRDGNLYTTDSAAGILYHFNSVSGAFTALTAPDQLASPQGLVLSQDQKILYVADYTQGLYTYDIAAKALRRLDVAPSLCVYGIDGLYRYENSLIAVQNGIRPHRVIRLSLDEAGRQVTHARVLAANLPAFDEPALGVITGNRFNFVANSQWNKFNDKNQLPKTGLHSPIVLRIALDSK